MGRWLHPELREADAVGPDDLGTPPFRRVGDEQVSIVGKMKPLLVWFVCLQTQPMDFHLGQISFDLKKTHNA